MKIIKVLILLMLVVPGFSQSAKVVQLSPEDAARAQSLYQQKASIDKQLSDLWERVYKVYLFEGNKIRPGFENGFQYSEDYKFVVPGTFQESYCSSEKYATKNSFIPARNYCGNYTSGVCNSITGGGIITTPNTWPSFSCLSCNSSNGLCTAAPCTPYNPMAFRFTENVPRGTLKRSNWIYY